MSIALPNGAHAADDFCSRLIVQAINQFCQLLPSGLNICQPVALVGTNPQCDTPQKTTLVPIGPATLRAAAPWAAPYAAFPATPGTLPTAAAMVGNTPVPAGAAAATPAETPAAIPAVAEKTTAPAAAAVTTPAAVTPAETPAAIPVVAEKTTVPAAAAVTTPAAVAPAETPAAIPVVAGKATVPAAASVTTPVAVTPVGTLAAPTVAAEQAHAAMVATPPVLAPEATVRAAVVTLPISPLPSATDTAWPVEMAGHAQQAEVDSVDALADFAFDKSELTPAGRAVLDAWLSEAPTNKKVRVSGHADRLGPEPYNLKLSLRRAQAVKQYLVGKGIAPNRILLEAKGEAQPVKRCKGGATPATKSCLAPNRRAQVESE